MKTLQTKTYSFGSDSILVKTNDSEASNKINDFLKCYSSIMLPQRSVTSILTKKEEVDKLKHGFWSSCQARTTKLLDHQGNYAFDSSSGRALLFNDSVLVKGVKENIRILSSDIEELVLLSGISVISYFDRRIIASGNHILHAASCNYLNKGLLIAGDKFAGKTSVLMSLLFNGGKMMSNDRTYLLSYPHRLQIAARASRRIKIGLETCKLYSPLQDYVRCHDMGEEEDCRDKKIVFYNLEKILGFGTKTISDLDMVIIPELSSSESRTCLSEINTSDLVFKFALDFNDGLNITRELSGLNAQISRPVNERKVPCLRLYGKQAVASSWKYVKEFYS